MCTAVCKVECLSPAPQNTPRPCTHLQVREEEIEAENRERVQKRSAAMLASKANKFASIHTERLKTFRQLATAKVGGGSAETLTPMPARDGGHPHACIFCALSMCVALGLSAENAAAALDT